MNRTKKDSWWQCASYTYQKIIYLWINSLGRILIGR